MKQKSKTVVALLIWLLFSSLAIADLRVASQNLNRFFDDKKNSRSKYEKVISNQAFQKRLSQLVTKIDIVYQFADIIAFQEVENIGILNQVADMVKQTYDKDYQPFLIEGNDVSGINTAYLISSQLKVKSFKSLFKDKVYAINGAKLYSRPPLLVEVCKKSKCITIINLHLRSMRGLRSKNAGERIAHKRFLQADTLAKWIDRFQKQYPTLELIILGDLNALTPSDKYVDVIGALLGQPDQDRPKWIHTDRISTNLYNASELASKKRRYSYLYKRTKQLLDYAIVSANLKTKVKHIEYSWIDYSFSDHAALTFMLKD